VKRMLIELVAIMCLTLSAQAQDSLNVSCLSKLEYWHDIGGTQIVGNLIYLVDSESGLHIMDMTDAAHPWEVGRYVTGSSCNRWYDVYVEGNLAYLATGDGLVILDITDPTHPTPLNTPRGASVYRVIVHNDIAIAKGDGHAPMAMNISNPDSIYPIPMDLPGTTHSCVLVGVTGDYFCIARMTATDAKLEILGLDSLQRLCVLAVLPLAAGAEEGKIVGNNAYLVASYWGVSIVDLSNPLEPFVAGLCVDDLCTDVDVAGNLAVIANDYMLEVWNIRNPALPVSVGECMPGGFFYNLFAMGTTAYVKCAFGRHALLTVDLSQPLNPVVNGSMGTTGYLSRIAIDRSTAYLADRRVDMRVIDLADPTHAVEIATTHSIDSETRDIAFHGNLAYLAGVHGINIYDISDPTQPDSIRCIGPETIFEAITVNGDYAYLLQSDDGLISNHLRTYRLVGDSMEMVSSRNGTFANCAITVDNGHLFAGRADGGFNIYSLDNPAAPLYIGSYSLHSAAITSDFAVQGSYVYLGLSGVETQVIDVSTPETPTLVAQLPEVSYQLAVRDSILITATAESLKVWNIAEPTQPVRTGFYKISGRVDDMQIFGSDVLVTSNLQVGVYHLGANTSIGLSSETAPMSYQLYPCYPNPFNPTTTISFTLPKAGNVKLTVFDVTGREVRSGIRGGNTSYTAGEHHLTFDGSALTSGEYFVRMEAGGLVKIQKMLLVK
jgi:hypothetical protein